MGNYLLLHYFFPEVVMQSKMIPCRNSCLVHFVSCVLRIKLMLWLFGLCDKYHELPLPFFSSFLLTVIYVLLSCELSLSLHRRPSQLPAPNSVALDMSLQTTSDVKVKKEAPVEVDSSPPDSPESISGRSDSSREALVKGKVRLTWEEGRVHAKDVEKTMTHNVSHYDFYIFTRMHLEEVNNIIFVQEM